MTGILLDNSSAGGGRGPDLLRCLLTRSSSVVVGSFLFGVAGHFGGHAERISFCDSKYFERDGSRLGRLQFAVETPLDD